MVAANVVFYAFHIGIILLGVMLSFTARNNPFVFLPYWISAQYLQALFFWSEHRYLMPFYSLLILIALSWYWKRLIRRFPEVARAWSYQPRRTRRSFQS